MPKSAMSLQSTQSSDKKVKVIQVQSKTDGSVPFDLRSILELPKPKKNPSNAFCFFMKEKNTSTKFEKIEGQSHKDTLAARMRNLAVEWKNLGSEN